MRLARGPALLLGGLLLAAVAATAVVGLRSPSAGGAPPAGAPGTWANVDRTQGSGAGSPPSPESLPRLRRLQLERRADGAAQGGSDPDIVPLNNRGYNYP